MGGEKQAVRQQALFHLGSPPHGRGKVIVYITAWRVAGITPAMRGKDGTIQLHELSAGITPAWAGKRNWAIGSRLLNWDHPRVGGEKLMGRPRRSVGAGSPPHRRGKAHHLDDITSERRITPAWAGKSAGFQSAPSGPRDHPRVGGEKHSGSCRTLTRSGSPPRGRGKALTRPRRPRLAGITPAWAGKSAFPALG